MKILVVGSESNLQEFKEKFSAKHEYQFFSSYSFDQTTLTGSDMIFDFFVGDSPEQFEIYAELNSNVFVNAPKISLAELAYYNENLSCNLFGFNGLPTFLNRTILEVSTFNDDQSIRQLCEALETEYLIVDDRVGMVTPRVISMIVNEAFYTLQEGDSLNRRHR